jgi:hypothetical protein
LAPFYSISRGDKNLRVFFIELGEEKEREKYKNNLSFINKNDDGVDGNTKEALSKTVLFNQRRGVVRSAPEYKRENFVAYRASL